MEHDTEAAIHDLNSKVGALRYLVERLYCQSFGNKPDPVASVQRLAEDVRICFESSAQTHGVEAEAIAFQEFLNVFFDGVVTKLRSVAGSVTRG